jgi:prevent-host-death family protein
MEKIIPISDLRTRAKKIVESVKHTRDPVVITQKGIELEKFKAKRAKRAKKG